MAKYLLNHLSLSTNDNEDNSKFTMNQESFDDQLKTSQEDELGVVFSEGEEEGVVSSPDLAHQAGRGSGVIRITNLC